MVLILSGVFRGPEPARADESVVRAVLFWSETCSHCHEVMEEHLPPLEEEYGRQLEIRTIELSDPEHYEVWIAAVEAFQVAPERRVVPMLFIGDTVLVGSGEIPERLPGLIEQHLAAGGVDYPTIPGLEEVLETTPSSAEGSTPQPTPTIKACHICDENVVVGTEDAVVHVLFFSDRLCEECVAVEKEVIAPLRETYGSQLMIERRDVEGSTENYNLLRSLERRYGVTHAEMPVIFVGKYVLTGEQEARENLSQLVEMYLDMGGVTLPEATSTAVPEATPTPEATAPPIHLAYFYQPGCRECDRVQLDLNYVQQTYPQLEVHDFDVQERAALCEWMGERAGVPERKRLTAPAVFVGDEALMGEDLHARTLEALIARHADTGAEATWEHAEGGSPSASPGAGATSRIIERFRSFSLVTVLAAGLVDGLNPCAFATLVFFISYLTFMGREGREVLLAGGAFAAAVFLTYLGVGFGVLKFLVSLPFLDAVSRWIYGFTAVLCLALAAGSLYDWWQARRGKAKDMRLAMPTRLRRRVNQAIRERAGAKAFVPVTFVTGVVVSVIELACTGQVYLPTILFVLGVPEMQAQAGFYLVLYNLMFILPLVVVFVLAYFGTTSRQLGLLIHRHTAKVKLATAGLFFLLAGWMVVTLV
jgi:cytochrome c biogenesis protein CcdA/glutaredoxin